MQVKKRIIGIVSLLVLTGSYLLVRYPLFELHGMKDWPLVLLTAGSIAVVIAGIILGKRVVPVFTAVGYILGFFGGFLFQSDRYDANSKTYSNDMWAIWTVSFLALITAGIIVEIINGAMNKKKKA